MIKKSKSPINQLLLFITLIELAAISPCIGFDMNQFAEQINNPRAIKSMVYQKALPLKPMGFSSEKEAMEWVEQETKKEPEDRKYVEKVFLKYQSHPVGFFYRTMEQVYGKSTNSTPRIGKFAGRFGTNWWFLSRNSLTMINYDESDKDTPTNNGCTAGQRNALEVLRLGIFTILPGSFNWIQNTSTFEGIDIEGKKLSGSATVDANGNVAHIDLSNAINIKYNYSNKFVGFPEEIIVLHDSGATNYTFKIHSLEFASAEMTAQDFSPQEYLVPSLTIIHRDAIDGDPYYYENGIKHSMTKTNSNSDSPRSGSVFQWSVRIVIILSIVFIFLTIVYKLKKK